MLEKQAAAAVEDSESPPSPARRRGPRATSLILTLAAFSLCGYLLWDLRPQLLFWAGVTPRVDLGTPGAYELGRARDNALATIAGAAGRSASRFEQQGTRYEIVAIPGTNMLVRRELKGPNLPHRPGQPQPPPDATPFVAEGRLVLDRSIPAYAQAFSYLVERGEATPVDGHLYVVLDGERPFQGFRTPALTLLLVALAGLNLFTIFRFVRGLVR